MLPAFVRNEFATRTTAPCIDPRQKSVNIDLARSHLAHFYSMQHGCQRHADGAGAANVSVSADAFWLWLYIAGHSWQPRSALPGPYFLHPALSAPRK